MYIYKTIFVLLLDVALNNAARILGVFPTPAISHQSAFRPIIHELARRGHQVTVLTADPAFPKDKPLPNLKEIDVHDISYIIRDEMLKNLDNSKEGFIGQIQKMFNNLTLLVEKQIQVPEFMELYKQKFDLLLVEAYIRPLLGLSHVFKVPIVQVSSFGGELWLYNAYGAPTHPLLYPSAFSQKLYNLTLYEKAQELSKVFLVEYFISLSEEFSYEMMRRNFGEDVPSYGDLQKNVQLLLLNEHQIWSDNHPVPPNIVFVGGIHQPPEPELSKELKTILDSSKNGVIYVSFGTNVMPSVLPSERIGAMIKVLSQLPYDVLLKWNKDDLPGKGKNVKVYKWFPQPTLLSMLKKLKSTIPNYTEETLLNECFIDHFNRQKEHPNVKLFITQGGLQSTDEAINAAVPLLGIPLHSDQWYNAEKYVRHKIGLQLDVHQITEENFKNAVETLINDKSFKENILRLRSIMRDQPIDPLSLAMWSIEHVLKYGGSHLRSPAAGLSFVEYYELPLLLTTTAIFLTAIAVMLISVILLWKLVKMCIVKFIRKNNNKVKSH